VAARAAPPRRAPRPPAAGRPAVQPGLRRAGHPPRATEHAGRPAAAVTPQQAGTQGEIREAERRDEAGACLRAARSKARDRRLERARVAAAGRQARQDGAACAPKLGNAWAARRRHGRHRDWRCGRRARSTCARLTRRYERVARRGASPPAVGGATREWAHPRGSPAEQHLPASGSRSSRQSPPLLACSWHAGVICPP